jgi:hypothetical protein
MSKTIKKIDTQEQGTLNGGAQLAVTFVVSLASMFALLIFTAKFAKAQDRHFLEKLNPNATIRSRLPGNFVPNDEVVAIPEKRVHWGEKILAEDNKGVLVSIREEVRSWEEQREYAKNWNLESTGLYNEKEQREKEKFLRKRGLKYVDKRISGEVKSAEKGSALAKVGKVQKALKPSSKVDIAPNVRLRFKARVLQGVALVNLENPYVDSKATVKANGRMNMHVGKRLDNIGLHTRVDYNVRESSYIAAVRKDLSTHWSTTLSSEQEKEDVAFSSGTNRTVSFDFSSGF